MRITTTRITPASQRTAILAPLVACFATGGAEAVIAAVRGGTRDGYTTHAWMLAMSAVYGPTDTHPSQGQHPEVLRVKASSLAELQEYLAR